MSTIKSHKCELFPVLVLIFILHICDKWTIIISKGGVKNGNR